MLRRRGFILKPIERPHVPLKNGTKNFRNSPPFKRSACFYVTIAWNFERYQYLKGALSGLRQVLATGSPIKIMNSFYFTLKALFVLKIFKFLS